MLTFSLQFKDKNTLKVFFDGYKKEYNEKGDLKNIEKFDNGKKVENAKELVLPDVFKAYYENGNVRYEGSYLNKMPIKIPRNRQPKDDKKSSFLKLF